MQIIPFWHLWLLTNAAGAEFGNGACPLGENLIRKL